MQLIFNWFISAVVIMISAYVLPGVVVDGLLAALVLAVILGAINAFVKPLLVILTFPITFITLGLFIFVIDALLVMLASSIVPGFSVAGFWSALIFAIVVSLVSSVMHKFRD